MRNMLFNPSKTAGLVSKESKRSLHLFVYVFLGFCSIFTGSKGSAQVLENVEVETYYIINENDAASTGLAEYPVGTVVYRVFADLCEGCKLKSIYGDANHVLRIESAAPILNSQFGSSFAHNISGSLFTIVENSALDSYFSLGAASNNTFGVPKQDDPDGSIWSARVAPQPLTNDDPALGITLPTSDGLISSQGASTVPTGWIVPDNVNEINEVFGNVNNGLTSFLSNNTFIQSLTGVQGNENSNKLLIAQITTSGELAFNLNLEIFNPAGTVVKVVGTEPVVGGEVFSPLLFYPPVCGCTDPNFLEFDPGSTCDDGSCLTEIIFGCLNQEACNFDPAANFNVPELCCFPDSCQGLDISILCPFLSAPGIDAAEDIVLYPNPTSGNLSIRFSQSNFNELLISIYDLTGRTIWNEAYTETQSGMVQLDLSPFPPGIYAVKISGSRSEVVRLIQKIN